MSPFSSTPTALHRSMNAFAPSRQPAGSPDSAGGQFAPSPLPEPQLAVDPTTGTSTPPADDAPALRSALEDAGIYPVTDPWGGIPDADDHWSDDLVETATTAVTAILGHPDPEVVERVAADPEWWTSDRLEIGVHFDVSELARAVRHHATPSPPSLATIDLDTDASLIRDQARRVFLESRALYQLAECKTIATQVLAEYPDAAYLALEDSDQPGGTWLTGDVTDANGNVLGDLEALDDEHWGAIDDLPPDPPGRERADGQFQPDTRFDFIAWRGARGSDVRIDLRAAAALDLRAGL